MVDGVVQAEVVALAVPVPTTTARPATRRFAAGPGRRTTPYALRPGIRRGVSR